MAALLNACTRLLCSWAPFMERSPEQQQPPPPLSLVSSPSKRCRVQSRTDAALENGARRMKLVPAAAAAPIVPEEPFAEDGEGARRRRQRRRVVAGVDQTRLLEPHLLADPDSRFAEYSGVQIHHKVARPSGEAGEAGEAGARLPAILLHGFGASLFSWERVMPELAGLLGAPALAFDRPAFGLTSRIFPSRSRSPAADSTKANPNPYSVGFSAAAALAFVDFLQSDRAVLIGHSAGSLVAIDSYFQCPEKVAALVLVAPALLAPLVMAQIAGSRKKHESDGKVEEEAKKEKADAFEKIRVLLLWVWARFTHLLRMIRNVVLLILYMFLGFLFRSRPAIWLVQKIMDKGGPWAVRHAFFDIIKVDKYVLDGYTRPLQCRDWEKALLEYCLALVSNTGQAAKKKKLQDVKCPVLILTGDTDRIVPDWNSKNLVKVFPRAEFKRIKNCGHMPHEETPREFLEAVKDWLLRTFQEKGTDVTSDPVG